MILIDNLDKYDTPETISILLELLAIPVIQSLFEVITGAKGIVILSLSDTLHKKMREDVRGSYSYLSDAFMLKTLLPAEARELLLQRFSAYSQSRFPIADDVIFEIVERNEGITRKIIASTKELLIEAASENIKTITYEVYKKLSTKKDMNSLHYQLSGDYCFIAGLRSIFTTLSNLSNPSNIKTIIRILSKVYDGLDLEEEEIDILKEESEIPIKIVGKRGVLDDENLRYMFKTLKENNTDIEEYLLWYTECFTVAPEIIEIKETSNERRLRKIIDFLEGNDLLDFKPIKYYADFYMKEVKIKELKKRMMDYAKNSLESFRKLTKTDLNDVKPNTLFEDINSCLWQIYNLYIWVSSSKMGVDIDTKYKFMDTLEERIKEFNKINNIKTKVLEKIRLIYLERYPVLIEKTKELSRLDIQKYLKYLDVIIEELTRAILMSLTPKGIYKELSVNGRVPISTILYDRINFSTTKFGILYLENVPKFDFQMIIIPFEYRWYGLIHGRSELAKHLRNQLTKTSRANFIFDKIVLKETIADTNFLISGIISKKFGTGFFDTVDLWIPKIILLEASLHKKKNLNKNLTAEITRLEQISKENNEIPFRVTAEKYKIEDIDKLIPPGMPEKQRSLFVDTKLVELAKERKAFLLTNDADFDMYPLSGYEKLIFLSENDFDIYIFESLPYLFEKIGELAPGKTIKFIIPGHNIEYITNAEIYLTGTDFSMRIKDIES